VGLEFAPTGVINFGAVRAPPHPTVYICPNSWQSPFPFSFPLPYLYRTTAQFFPTIDDGTKQFGGFFGVVDGVVASFVAGSGDGQDGFLIWPQCRVWALCRLKVSLAADRKYTDFVMVFPHLIISG